MRIKKRHRLEMWGVTLYCLCISITHLKVNRRLVKMHGDFCSNSEHIGDVKNWIQPKYTAKEKLK